MEGAGNAGVLPSGGMGAADLYPVAKLRKWVSPATGWVGKQYIFENKLKQSKDS